MADTQESNVESPPGHADLTEALCIKCGYALAGLQESGVCPECGVPIEDSFVRWLEGVSDRVLDAVRRGSRMLFWTPPVLFVSWLLLGIAGAQRHHWSHERIARGIFGVSYAAILLTAGLFASAIWRATKELDGAPDWAGLAWRRGATRTSAATVAVATSLFPLWAIFDIQSEAASRLLFLVSMAAALGAVGLLWTYGEYLNCIGTALREKDLAREAKIGHWLASVAFVCGLASTAGIAAGRAWAIAGILVLPGLGAAFFSCLSLGFANVTLWSRIDAEIERRTRKTEES